MCYRIKLLIVSLLFSLPIFSQTAIEDEINNYLVWFVNENNESSIDLNELKDAVDQYLENPIQLNICSYDQLHQLNFLSSYQAYQIIRYRNKYGFFIHKHELLAVPGIELDDYKILQYLITLQNKIYVKKQFREFKTKIIIGQNTALHQQREYEKNQFNGSPHKLFAKIDMKSSDGIRFGLQIEKDAGEGMSHKKVDYVAGFVEIRPKKLVEKFIIGDYKLQYGQGLTLNNYFTIFSTNSSNHNILKKNDFKVHSSLNETQYFRGAVIKIPFKNFKLDLFYSNKKSDATLDNNLIVSFQNTGYHRTNSEIQNKNSFTDENFGGNLTYTYRQLTLGLVTLYNHINKPIQFQRNYQQQYKLNQYNLFTGFYLNYQYKNVDLFGEISSDSKFNSSGIVGLTHQLSPSFLYHVSYRNYHQTYYNRNANAFGKNTLNNNEQGLNLKSEIKVSSQFDVIANIDFFKRVFTSKIS